MPGVYAHLVSISRLKAKIEQTSENSFPQEAKISIQKWLRFCELGAISPDMPALHLINENSKAWGNIFHSGGKEHCLKTESFIQNGAIAVRNMRGPEKYKGFAWLAGFLAHVVLDVVVHPAINLYVAANPDQQAAHRIMEMHQDTYMFEQLNMGEMFDAEYLDQGVRRCHNPKHPGLIDSTIYKLWSEIIKKTYPRQREDVKPEINKWFNWFNIILDDFAEEAVLIPFGRHILAEHGLSYPKIEEIDYSRYIKNLKVPYEKKRDYNFIFDKALEHCYSNWTGLARAVFDDESFKMSPPGDWNLDTGSMVGKEFIFWEKTEEN